MSLLIASVEGAADRVHVHASHEPWTIGTQQGDAQAGDQLADCPHCLHLVGLNAHWGPAPSGMSLARGPFDPTEILATRPLWRPSPPIPPPIAA